MTDRRQPENILDRIRAHAKPSTEENIVTENKIEREENESTLTTADLARSAETEERREDQRRENLTSDARDIAAQNLPSARTDTAARTETMARTDTSATQRTTGAAGTAAAVVPAREGDSAPLVSSDDARNFRSRWENLQVNFVDEPRRAVEQADSLVAEAIKRLAEVFADERQRLEKQWDRGDNVSTEDLRVALQHYRAFFGRLLSI
jgi:subtilase family serine protease